MAGSPASADFLERISRVPRFAHHPTCDCFHNHLLHLGTRAICLGCTCVAVGILVSTAVLCVLLTWRAALLWQIGSFAWISLGVAFFLPTLAQPFQQQKMFKVVSRTMLGVSIVLLWFGAMIILPATTAGFALRLIFIGVFVTAMKLSLSLRSRFTKSPCDGCTGGSFPFCAGNRSVIERFLPDLIACGDDRDRLLIRLASEIVHAPEVRAFEIGSLPRFVKSSETASESVTVSVSSSETEDQRTS